MDVVEFRPEHSQLVYTFGGAAPVMRVRPGTALQLWSEDAFNHALTSVSDVASKVWISGISTRRPGRSMSKGRSREMPWQSTWLV